MTRGGWPSLLAALLCAACVGPTLEVGERIAEADGGDALDGGDAGAPPRDAGAADRDPHLEERRNCRDDRDCVFNRYRDHCSPLWLVCVECTDDRHCESNRCVEPEGYCRPPRYDDPSEQSATVENSSLWRNGPPDPRPGPR